MAFGGSGKKHFARVSRYSSCYSSILGPTIFLLYINDLPNDVADNITIYGDNTTFYSKCDWVSDSWWQLELAFELESNL